MSAPRSVIEALEKAKRFASKPGLNNIEKQFVFRRFAGPSSCVGRISGVRIAHLTDQHFGRVTPEAVQRYAVELAMQSEPDAVMITGDFVCHGQAYLDQLSDVLSDIDVPLFCVLGNHDYWSGAKEVRHALKKAGAEILDNAWTTIRLQGEDVQIVGLDDDYTGHADLEAATKGLDHKRVTIALSHIAEMAEGLWAHHSDLVLAGHTHAGQVTLAKLHEVMIGRIAGHKYVHGLYGSREEARALYVGAGIGAAVVPLRLGDRAKREVAIFELGAAAGDFSEHHVEQDALPGKKPSEKKNAKRKNAVARKMAKREKRNGKK